VPPVYSTRMFLEAGIAISYMKQGPVRPLSCTFANV